MISGGRRVVVIDNYDSFTYNLVQLLAEQGADVTVRRNDATSVEELGSYDALVVSPGPGGPGAAGVSVAAIRDLSGRLPILGVCLGHQCLAEAFGGEVVRFGPQHGTTSWVHHDRGAPFSGLSVPFEATRYHSLVVERESLPHVLRVSAWTADGVVMGLRHVRHPTYGVQFHPEAILTVEGPRLLRNFLSVAMPGALS